ncbi:unnamed protein product, partial [Brenthis ino]
MTFTNERTIRDKVLYTKACILSLQLFRKSKNLCKENVCGYKSFVSTYIRSCTLQLETVGCTNQCNVLQSQ